MTAHAGNWSLAIDLGARHVAAATSTSAREGGSPTATVLPPASGGTSMPSLVCLDDKGLILTGEAARKAADRSPERTERAVVRALVEQERTLLGGRTVSTVDLAAAVLSDVLARARSRHGGALPGRTVLTHPADWAPTRLARLGAAAEAAGITRPAFLAEPVAAARHYAADPGPGGLRDLPQGARCAVYDVGAALKVSVLAWDGAEFTVVRTAGDPDLGGDQLDDCLRELLAERVLDRDPGPWQELWEGDSPDAARQRASLSRALVAAREALSGSASVDVRVPGYPEPFLIRAHEFRTAARPVVERGYELLADTVRLDGREPADLPAVLIAGGAGRTPLVSDLIVERTHRLPLLAAAPESAVALGALTTPRAVPHRPQPADEQPVPPPEAKSPGRPAGYFIPDDLGFEF